MDKVEGGRMAARCPWLIFTTPTYQKDTRLKSVARNRKVRVEVRCVTRHLLLARQLSSPQKLFAPCKTSCTVLVQYQREGLSAQKQTLSQPPV